MKPQRELIDIAAIVSMRCACGKQATVAEVERDVAGHAIAIEGVYCDGCKPPTITDITNAG